MGYPETVGGRRRTGKGENLDGGVPRADGGRGPCRETPYPLKLNASLEITFDYNTTDWDMAHPFACACGTLACVGVVRGYRHLDDAARGRLLPFLAEHLRVRP